MAESDRDPSSTAGVPTLAARARVAARLGRASGESGVTGALAVTLTLTLTLTLAVTRTLTLTLTPGSGLISRRRCPSSS